MILKTYSMMSWIGPRSEYCFPKNTWPRSWDTTDLLVIFRNKTISQCIWTIRCSCPPSYTKVTKCNHLLQLKLSQSNKNYGPGCNPSLSPLYYNPDCNIILELAHYKNYGPGIIFEVTFIFMYNCILYNLTIFF